MTRRFSAGELELEFREELQALASIFRSNAVSQQSSKPGSADVSIAQLPSFEATQAAPAPRRVALPDSCAPEPARRQRPGDSPARAAKGPLLRNAWSEEEHRMFLDGVERFGREKPTRIAQFIGTRSSAQVISHSQKTFEHFTKDVDALLHGQLHVELPKQPPFALDAQARAEMEQEFGVPAFAQIQLVNVVDVPRVTDGVLKLPLCLLQQKMPTKLLRRCFYVLYNQTQRPKIAAACLTKRFDISAAQIYAALFGSQ